MNSREFQARYEAVEHAVKIGAMTAVGGMARVALLAGEAYGCTPAERAVLDAMAGVHKEDLQLTIDEQGGHYDPLVPACQAELARRAAK